MSGSASCWSMLLVSLQGFPRVLLTSIKQLRPDRSLSSQYAAALRVNGQTTWQQEHRLSLRVGLEPGRLTWQQQLQTA